MLNVYYPCWIDGIQLLLLLILNLLKRQPPFYHLLQQTLSQNDNHHLLLQHNAAIFILASGSNTDQLGHLLPQSHIKSHPNIILSLSSTWELTFSILSPLGRSQMDLMCTLCFGEAISSSCPYVPNNFTFGKESFRSCKCTHLPLCSKMLQCLFISGWCYLLLSILQADDWDRVLLQLDKIFQHMSLLKMGTRIQYGVLSFALVSSQLGGKCQTLIYIKSCRYIGLSGHSSPQNWVNSSPIVCVVLALHLELLL